MSGRVFMGTDARARGPSKARRGRRGDILDAALKVFTEAGYSYASVEDIGHEARASIGSIYHHFKGKQDIAAALYVEGLADYHRGLLQGLRDGHDSAEEAVTRLVKYHLRWVEENRDLARFLLTSREPDVVGATDEALRGMNREIFRALEMWIDRWVGEGEILPLPIGLFHSIVLGPSQEFARHWLAGRVEESIEEAEEVLAEAAWMGVKA
jgi:AcrR family transcriptional regulator